MGKLEAHPDAAIFPMMSSEELSDLAADIKANGLKHDIVLGKLDDKEVIIDGRNRYAACEIANIEPKFQMINGEDVKAFIISNNVSRRHLNSGQRAMAVAMMYPDGTQGKKTATSSATEQVPKGRLSMARTVFADSRALAEEVMAGGKFLDAAYQEARERADAKDADFKQRAQLGAEAPDLLTMVLDSRLPLDQAMSLLEIRKQEETKLKAIQDTSPDLVQLVREKRMSVQDAIAAHEKRHEEDRNQRSASTLLLATVVRLFGTNHPDPKQADHLMAHFDPKLWPVVELGEPNSKLFQTAADVLAACARLRKEQEKSK